MTYDRFNLPSRYDKCSCGCRKRVVSAACRQCNLIRRRSASKPARNGVDTRQCPWCGTSFVVNKLHRKWCSTRCRRRADKKKQTERRQSLHGPPRLGYCAIEACGKEYIDSTFNFSKKFCSRRCASRASVKRLSSPCITCGEPVGHKADRCRSCWLKSISVSGKQCIECGKDQCCKSRCKTCYSRMMNQIHKCRDVEAYRAKRREAAKKRYHSDLQRGRMQSRNGNRQRQQIKLWASVRSLINNIKENDNVD